MDIKKYTKCRPFLCLRRGVSGLRYSYRSIEDFSLPTQRCFWSRDRRQGRHHLFSAYAEVFPGKPSFRSTSTAFLCLRRGVSLVVHGENRLIAFSLPTQRCFPFRRRIVCVQGLFSAYAEVFPLHRGAAEADRAFLCLRRGVSDPDDMYNTKVDFSLPTQRCFLDRLNREGRVVLFSAYAEVFLSLGSILCR